MAIRAAREAGRGLWESYLTGHQVKIKGFRDIATEADLLAERVALEVIREGCPDARFVSEESYQALNDYGDIPTWYIDPLDGTTNYARGLPGWSVSVAMARHGVVECGVVYDPLLDQLFYAAQGEGAYLLSAGDKGQGKRLRVSASARLIDCVILLDWPRDQAIRRMSLAFLSRLALEVDAVRSRGSAALGFCYVAAGWADAYFQYTLGPWDVAAGMLIVQEAGGMTSDLRGGPSALTKPDWLASNGRVHEAILALQPFTISKPCPLDRTDT
ncbi:MAG: inositol monophosphatase [Chloroflexi bacterium]|nr:inositol monophosphatase [Chloroflexota bacterium]